ncbi:MAG TPA: hypothetical protein VLM11_11735 [Streptosporangiaceae bacterium]|nr:hypothetical protein [Streptosporangiaceae bacterium]
MRIASPSLRPSAPAEPADLIKEARRRQRRRWLAAGVASLVVIAGATTMVGGVAAHRHSRANAHARRQPTSSAPRKVAEPPIPRSIGTSVLWWPAGFGQCCGAVAVDNLSTGRITQGQEPDIAQGDFQPLLTQVGNSFVFVGNGVTAIRADLRGHPRVLGPTTFFAPAAAPSQVWLFQVRSDTQGPIQGRLVPVAGGSPGPPVMLPAGAQLPVVRGTDAGLLLQGWQGHSALALWNPGSIPRTLPYSPLGADGFDATPRLVAYGTSCSWHVTAPNDLYEPNAGYETCQLLRVFDVVTGKLTSFPAPPGTGGWVPNGFNLVSAISHDGRLIAAYAATLPQGTGHVRLYVMRITSPASQPTPVPTSTAFLFARTAWSANDSWLLYQGPGEHLWAYQVASGRTGASSTTCCRYTVMVTTPSRSR